MTGAPETAQPPARPRKFTYKESKEWETIEDDILQAEEKVAGIQATLDDPEFFVTRSSEANDMLAQLSAAKAAVERLYVRWEELSKIAAGNAS